MTPPDLSRRFSLQSIAVLGASTRLDKLGGNRLAIAQHPPPNAAGISTHRDPDELALGLGGLARHGVATGGHAA